MGTGAAAMLAGCQTQRVEESGGTETATQGTTTGTAAGGETLVVATYSSFVDAPSTSPGAWLKEQFESEFDATLVYQTPDSEINYYLERAIAGVDFEADAYVGLDTEKLLRVDGRRGEGEYTDRLFRSAAGVSGRDTVKSGIEFDPEDRAVPFSTGYISLVWDATADDGTFTAPATFEELAQPETAGRLLAQNPASSTTGKAFMLHTVDRFGPDGFLDYWDRLRENGVTVLGEWSDSYSAYSNGEAPMVVSYSTDQVFANRADQNLDRHQIRFLNDQAYANPEGAALFRETDTPALAEEFLSFLLEPEIQAGIARRNVTFPAIPDAPLSETYDEYAKEPPEPVTFSYQELEGRVGGWTDEWTRRFTEG